MREVVDALKTLRVPAVLDEADLCAMVADCLTERGIGFAREYRLGGGCRADFMLDGGLVIEVKAMERASARVARQLGRYAAFDEVKRLVLVTNTALNMPGTIKGKPLYTLYLKRLWGVAL